MRQNKPTFPFGSRQASPFGVNQTSPCNQPPPNRGSRLDRPFETDPIEYIRGELQTRRARRPEYSLRAFARDLNMSPSTISEVLNGKVGLSPLKSQMLARKLRLAAPHDEQFVDLISARHARSAKARQESEMRVAARLRSMSSHLSIEKFKVISDWHHNAILELVDLSAKYHSVEALARALKIEKAAVSGAVDRLIAVGELAIVEKVWSTRSAVTVTGEGVPSAAIKQYHTQIFKKAQDALYQQKFEECDFQSSFFCVDSRDLPNLKTDLLRLRRELIAKYGHSPERDSVYNISLQLFKINEDK